MTFYELNVVSQPMENCYLNYLVLFWFELIILSY